MLAADPLGKLSISTECFLDIVKKIVDAAPRHADGTPRLMATGGGGYHPLLVARACTGLWGLLSGRSLAEQIPPAGAEVLRSAGWEVDAEQPYFQKLFASRLDHPAELKISESIQILADSARRHPYFRS
jgi:acetoin utilization protein AcuC